MKEHNAGCGCGRDNWAWDGKAKKSSNHADAENRVLVQYVTASGNNCELMDARKDRPGSKRKTSSKERRKENGRM